MQLTELERAGGQAGPTGDPPPYPSPSPLHANHPKGPGFSAAIMDEGSGAAQRGQDGVDSYFKCSAGIDTRCRGDHLLQLGGVVDACSCISVCHFTSFKVTAARVFGSRALVFTGQRADVLMAPTAGKRRRS